MNDEILNHITRTVLLVLYSVLWVTDSDTWCIVPHGCAKPISCVYLDIIRVKLSARSGASELITGVEDHPNRDGVDFVTDISELAAVAVATNAAVAVDARCSSRRESVR